MNTSEVTAWMPAILAVISLIGVIVNGYFTYRTNTKANTALAQSKAAAKSSRQQVRTSDVQIMEREDPYL